MKNIFFILFLVFSFNVYSQEKEVIEWSGLDKYSISNTSIDCADVVFIGNSITENWFKYHSAFFKDNNYIGRGISGHTSYQFLLRFREDVIKLNPRIVIINAGTNDIAENCGPYVEEYTFGNIISGLLKNATNYIPTRQSCPPTMELMECRAQRTNGF